MVFDDVACQSFFHISPCGPFLPGNILCEPEYLGTKIGLFFIRCLVIINNNKNLRQFLGTHTILPFIKVEVKFE